jgi:hypothetical protein
MGPAACHAGCDAVTRLEVRRPALRHTLVRQPAPARRAGLTWPRSILEISRLLAARLLQPHPPGHATHWLNWRRRHQARSRWYHQHAQLARDGGITLVS